MLLDFHNRWTCNVEIAESLFYLWTCYWGQCGFDSCNREYSECLLQALSPLDFVMTFELGSEMCFWFHELDYDKFLGKIGLSFFVVYMKHWY